MENGETIAAVSRSTGISRKTIQDWRATYSRRPKTDDAKRLKQLEDENARLKKLVEGASTWWAESPPGSTGSLRSRN